MKKRIKNKEYGKEKRGEYRFFIVLGIILAIVLGLVIYQEVLGYRKLPYITFNLKSNEYIYTDMPPINKVGDFNFINQKGERINQQRLGDTIYIADYIFTKCPGICKMMSIEISEVYKAFKDEPRVKILSHTSKPHEDSISVLLTYAKQYGVKDHNKWMFLTGDNNELKRMAYEQYGIISPEEVEEDGSFVHTEQIVLVDWNKYIRGYYSGTDENEVRMMINDIKELLKEQESNR